MILFLYVRTLHVGQCDAIEDSESIFMDDVLKVFYIGASVFYPHPLIEFDFIYDFRYIIFDFGSIFISVVMV